MISSDSLSSAFTASDSAFDSGFSLSVFTLTFTVSIGSFDSTVAFSEDDTSCLSSFSSFSGLFLFNIVSLGIENELEALSELANGLGTGGLFLVLPAPVVAVLAEPAAVAGEAAFPFVVVFFKLLDEAFLD